MVISNVRYGSYITTSKFVKECEIENEKKAAPIGTAFSYYEFSLLSE